MGTLDYSNDHSSVDEIWSALAGMFGADSVKRKYGLKPPHEWRVSVDQLRDYELTRGMRKLRNSGKPHLPSLPEFMRMCREVGDDGEKAVPMDQQITQQPIEKWTLFGNRHLLAYIIESSSNRKYHCSNRMLLCLEPADFTKEKPDKSSKTKRSFVNGRGTPDPETAALTQCLVDAKNAWSEEMRELESAGKVPSDNGKVLWNEAMVRAELSVEAVRRDYAKI